MTVAAGFSRWKLIGAIGDQAFDDGSYFWPPDVVSPPSKPPTE